MSRLPTLSTPNRSPGGASMPAASGIPTPASRRPRNSLGPNVAGGNPSPRPDAEMDQALKDVLRRRPPSSLGNGSDADSPSLERSLYAPRTPGVGGLRPKTPSSVGSSIATPSSRPGSRPSLSARTSLSASSAGVARRTSMASSTSASTPSYRRPESRLGVGGEKWVPAIGDRVRLPSHGYEGTLRYLGETHIRDGIWAGVELEGLFQGKGRNDGSVDNVRYFDCAPNCGIFMLAEKLAPPTSAMANSTASRPASAASHRSVGSYSQSGRMTPSQSGRMTPSQSGRMTPSQSGRMTPSQRRAMTPNYGHRADDDGSTSRSNMARAEAKITAGSRASKYIGVTAKQLEAKSGLASSTSATPRASKIGMPGGSIARARPSIGGSLATPKARSARSSAAGGTASEMMPPPPSPQLNRLSSNMSLNVQALEDEIKELKRRNAELEAANDAAEAEAVEARNAAAEAAARAEAAEAAASAQPAAEPRAPTPEPAEDHSARLAELEAEAKAAKEEAESLRAKLAETSGSMDDTRRQTEQLQADSSKLQSELEAKVKELEDLRSEMALAAERAASELDAGMEAKQAEVQKVEERATAAESELAEMKKLVDELTLAGNQIIELNESKQISFELQIKDLEEKLAKAEAAARASSDGTSPKGPTTAAEIDNETLTAQVKHLQGRISSLEEQLDEARGQADENSDAWLAKYNKAREGEGKLAEELSSARAEIKAAQAETAARDQRVAELQGALAENQSALEEARAEIEQLRKDASEGEGDAARLAEVSEALSAAERRIKELEAEKVRGGGNSEASIRGYHHIVSEMKAENAALKAEVASLKEELKLLHELHDDDDSTASTTGGAGAGDAKLRKQVQQMADTIKEYEREVSELESLVEAKIYREDELETQLSELERQLERIKRGDVRLSQSQSLRPPPASNGFAANGANGHGAHGARNGHSGHGGHTGHSVHPNLSPAKSPVRPTSSTTSAHARTDSNASTASAASGTSAATDSSRCELCEGPHELDACPVFAGSLDTPKTTPAKKGKWCLDCESSAHDTAECPMADDVF